MTTPPPEQPPVERRSLRSKPQPGVRDSPQAPATDGMPPLQKAPAGGATDATPSPAKESHDPNRDGRNAPDEALELPNVPPPVSDTSKHTSSNDKAPGVSLFAKLPGLKLGIDDKYIYVRALITKDVTGAYDDRYGLEKKEVKLIKRTLINHVKSKLSADHPFAVVDDKERLLLRKATLSSEDNEVLENAASVGAIVTVFEGHSRYPEWDEEKWKAEDLENLAVAKIQIQRDSKGLSSANQAFQLAPVEERHRQLIKDEELSVKQLNDARWERVYLPKHHASGLRYRWTKVQIVPRDDAYETTDKLAWRLDWAKTHLHNDNHVNHHTQLYYIPLDFECREETLESLLVDVERTSDPAVAANKYAVVNSLVKIQSEADRDEVAVHDLKFYDSRDTLTQSMLSLQHVTGSYKLLKLDLSSRPVMIQGDCTKLFFPNSSVAEFSRSYLGSHPDRQMLGQALVGKCVLIEHEGVSESRVICLISNETPATASAEQKHPAMANTAVNSLKYPEWLCLNVGTPHRPRLIAQELCTLAPMQSFKRPVTQSLFDDLRQLRDDETKPSAQRLPVGAKPVFRQSGEKKKVVASEPLSLEEKDAQLKKGFKGLSPNILFAEVGRKRVSNPAWHQLCNELPDHHILRDNGLSDKLPNTARPLFLEYDGRDRRQQWKAQLQAYIETHTKDRSDRKTVFIIGFAHNEDRRPIYKACKVICDNVCDVQSYFVNVDSLQMKADEPHGRSVEMSGADLIRRMRVRNATPLQLDPNDKSVKTYALAVHVSKIMVDAAKVHAEGYTIRVKELYVVSVVTRLMDKMGAFKTKVSLKSHDQIQQGAVLDVMREEIDEINTTTGVGTHHNFVILRSGYIPAGVTRSESSAVPLSAIPAPTTGFSNFQETAVNSVSEWSGTKPRKFTAKLASAAQRDEVDYAAKEFESFCRSRERDSNKFASVFLQEDTTSVYAKRAKLLTDEQIKNSRDFTPSIKLIKDALLLKDGEQGQRELFLLSGSKLFRAQLKGDVVRGARGPPNASVTDGEIDGLACLWRDDYLEFYRTTVPVPTHLARMAADRAKIHVREDNGIKNRANATAPPYRLPDFPYQKGNKNHDTLWYL